MRQEKGFTLIELLVVIAILGVLAMIAIPRITTSTATAKTNACKTNIDIMNTQIEMYYADKGSYPTSLATVTNDPCYFPDGAPVCPSTGLSTSYSMDGGGDLHPYRVKCTYHNTYGGY
jgi:prepilin-type N-terminal cleavage/methylation domain-containing protein